MISTILIFIIVLGILVFVHEFGHFIVAKKSGMQVEEFGFGFPPRIVGIQKVNGKWRWVWFHRKSLQTPTTPSGSASHPSLTGGDSPRLSSDSPRSSPPFQGGVPPSGGEVVGGSTVYSINAIPLGGFVRILGENNDNENNPGSFINKSFGKRLFTLVAGVIMNVLLAWVLLSAGYMVGLPVAINSPSDIPRNGSFGNQRIAILEVVKDLPADKAGLKPNDILLNIDGQNFSAVSEIQSYIKAHAGQPVVFKVERHGADLSLPITPSANPPEGQGPTGIGLSVVGKLKFPLYVAVWQGAITTVNGLEGIVRGLYSLFTSSAGFSSLGGPVKIAKLTGEVAGLGFVYLLQFTAFLSLNLAVLNILPFPALDGGRVLFLIIEKIRRKRNSQKVEQWVNTAGFVFLILLMVAVTVNDLIKK